MNEEERWTPVVRRKRKKSNGYEDDGELRVGGGNIMYFWNLNGIGVSGIGLL